MWDVGVRAWQCESESGKHPLSPTSGHSQAQRPGCWMLHQVITLWQRGKIPYIRWPSSSPKKSIIIYYYNIDIDSLLSYI